MGRGMSCLRPVWVLVSENSRTVRIRYFLESLLSRFGNVQVDSQKEKSRTVEVYLFLVRERNTFVLVSFRWGDIGACDSVPVIYL